MKQLSTLLLAVIIGIAASSLWAQDTGGVKKHWWNLQENDSLVFEPVPFNCPQNDYSPLLMQDNRMFFNSDRKNPLGHEADLAYNEHIYLTKKMDTVWSYPSKTYFFNSDDQSAIAGLKYDGSKVFLYKPFNNGDLYFSEIKGNYWTAPVSLKSPINSDGHEQSIAEENHIMVISSDRAGGLGGHDIYWSRADADGNYTELIPLSAVNSAGDELDVRLTRDGKKLYFSSDGLSESLGQLDIYWTSLDSLGNWGKPHHLDAPVNSAANDRYFFDLDSAFLMSSDRPGGTGGDDIYFGRVVPKKLKVKKMIVEAIAHANVDTLITIEKNIGNKPPHIKRDTTAFIEKEHHKAVIKDTTAHVEKDHYITMNQMLDKAGYKDYYAMVQIGAFYKMSLEQFRQAYPSLKDIQITSENVKTSKGTLQKFLVDHKFATLKDAAVIQQEMWDKHKIKDAFVAVYSKDGVRIAIYNTLKKEFVILKGDAKPVYF